MESKKIKKIQKVNKSSIARFKKSNIRPARAQVGLIKKPPRLFDESEVFVLESDLFFGMKDNQIFFDISMMNLFKYITSVEVRKDMTEKFVTLLLEPKPQYPTTSWRTVVDNFEKISSPSVQEWKESLKAFGSKYESFMADFEGLKKETDMQKKMALYKMRHQAAAKRLYILTTFPALEMRYRMKKDGVKLSELCINETFLKEVGYTIQNFTSTVLNEGLPQFFPRKALSRAIGAVKAFMEQYMVNDVEEPAHPAELLMKTGYRKKVVLQTVELVEISDGDLIMSFVLYIKEKSLPYGSYQIQPFSQDFLEGLQNNDKEKEYLYKTYYGENFQGFHSNTDKVCKIKELSPQ